MTQALVSMLMRVSLISIQWSLSVVQFLVIFFVQITEPQQGYMQGTQIISGHPSCFSHSWVKKDVTYLMVAPHPEAKIGHQLIPLILAAT
jgi:hypothetical protein